MRTEPERPIEQELRRYARWRDDQYRAPAGISDEARLRLHDAIRRAQGTEVGSLEKAPLGLWLRLIWPRLALATGVCGVILAIGIALNQNHTGDETSYAQAERDAQQQPIDPSTAGDELTGLSLPMAEQRQSPVPDSPEAQSQDTTGLRKTSLPRAAPIQSPRPSPRPEPEAVSEVENVPAKAPIGNREESGRVAERLAQPTRSPILQGPVSRSDSLALDQARAFSESDGLASGASLAGVPEKPNVESNAERSRSARDSLNSAAVGQLPPKTSPTVAGRPSAQGVSYQRIQRTRINFNSPALPKVLASFHFIREGETVELVDLDGSVYRGTLVPPASTVRPTADGPSVASGSAASRVVMQRRYGLAASAAAQTLAPAPSIPFTVEGTNITLGLPVTFVGNLQEAAMGRSASSASPAPSSDASAGAGSITGQVTLGDGTRFELVAEPRR